MGGKGCGACAASVPRVCYCNEPIQRVDGADPAEKRLDLVRFQQKLRTFLTHFKQKSSANQAHFQHPRSQARSKLHLLTP